MRETVPREPHTPEHYNQPYHGAPVPQGVTPFPEMAL